ncbi:MAG TPA: hypothetical protein VIJ07_00695, partial [Dermatophilaceae bacterium]
CRTTSPSPADRRMGSPTTTTHRNDPDGSHDHVVLGGATGDRFACVALEQTGNGEPVIFLDVTMSPEEAVKVANALRKAARMAGVTR